MVVAMGTMGTKSLQGSELLLVSVIGCNGYCLYVIPLALRIRCN